MANENLRTLLRLQSPQNVTGGDPWMAQRRAEITSGLDDFLPDADSPEYKFQQVEDARKYGVALPRADYRSSNMSALRGKLGIAQREHEQALEQAGVKGAYDIAAQEAGQASAMDRALITQQAITGRSDADRASREQTLETRLQAMEQQQAARDAAALERAKFNQGAVTERAQARQPKGLLDMLRGFFPGGAEEEIQTPIEEPAVTPRRRILSVR